MLLFKGNPALAAYGIALSGLGLLSTTGFMLAMDTYGPISDNANGIFEMSGALKDAGEDSNAHKIVAKLDAVGNTTKALTKGLAIATAVIAATALFRSFMADAGLLSMRYSHRLDGGLHRPADRWRGSVPVLLVRDQRGHPRGVPACEEVRRQFREIVGIMDYDPRSGSDKGKPDYQRCVAISTAAAQKELMSPAVLALSAPILVGFRPGLWRSAEGRGRARRFPCRRDSLRPVDGCSAFQRGRSLGQREEEDRGRHVRRQGHSRAQGRRCRRHRRRPVQGHRRPGSEPDDQGYEPGRDPGCPDRHPADFQCRARHYRGDRDSCSGRRHLWSKRGGIDVDTSAPAKKSEEKEPVTV